MKHLIRLNVLAVLHHLLVLRALLVIDEIAYQEVQCTMGIAGFISGTDIDGQTVITITNADAVNNMIWALFSIFPAIIAGIMIGLLYLYPIKK